jgi:eukaryotic-like serine/threonine-protein kinase
VSRQARFSAILDRGDGERLREKRDVSAASERALPVGAGDVIDGKFEVEKVLGTGGMGTVVAARHLRLDQRVALKFIHRELARDDEVNRRFLREAKAAARLRSEHVCRVLDVATLSDGTPYIVMEFLEGLDLGDVLRGDGPLPVATAVEYLIQACEAIAEAHAAGIVHRDLKPQNLFLTRRPSGLPLVKVLDFGISKLEEAGTVAQTATDRVVGSPAYMSPEQLRSARETDARSDIWSLGVVLYELLAGHPPFRGHNLPALALAIVSESSMPIEETRAGLPADLVAAIGRCLEKDPSARFDSVAELAAALVPFAPARSGPTIAAISEALRGAGRARPAPRRRRRRTVVASIGLLSIVAAALAIGAARSREPESSAATRPAMSTTPGLQPAAEAAPPKTDARRPPAALPPPTGTPYERGVEHLRRWEPLAARSALEDAVARAPDDPMARFQICRALDMAGDEAGAIAHATRGLALERVPDRTRSLIEACRRQAAGDAAGAAALYAQLFARSPDLEIGLELGDNQYYADDAIGIENTAAALRALPVPQRNDARIVLLEGDALDLRRDLAGARQHYARAAERAAVEGRTVVRAVALGWEGTALRLLGELRDANQRLEESLRLFVEAGERGRLTIDFLNQQAIVNYTLGEHPRGAKMVEEAVERSRVSKPEWWPVLVANLACFRFLMGDHDAGRRGIEESAQVGSRLYRTTKANYFRGWERLHAGDAAAAVRLFRAGQKAEKKEHDDLHFVYFPGEALFFAGDLRGARTALEHATNRATRDSWHTYAECARVVLAMTALAEGKPAEAEALARRAIVELDRMEVRDCRVRGRIALSRALRALGKPDTHGALAQAAAIGSQDVRVRWELETAVAEDEIARRDALAAQARLARVLDEAAKFEIPNAALGAAIVLGTLELADPSTAAQGKARLAGAAKRARAAGQRLVEKRAREILARPAPAPR